MTDYTDLCAQGEAAMEGTTPGEWKAAYSKWEPDNFIVQTEHPCRRVLAQFDGDGDGPDDQSLADARFIAWARNNVPALIAAIRELEATLLSVLRREAETQRLHDERMEAAEAKLAEVEKERNQAVATAEGDHEPLVAEEEARRAAEATVATLQAQVEAMQKQIDKLTIIDRAGDISIAALNKQVEAMRGALTAILMRAQSTRGEQAYRELPTFVIRAARAALTTENQTNG